MIKNLRFKDLASGWTLQETTLDQFNLLVGLSGAGKSWTLRAIQAICRSAAGQAPSPSLQWEVGMESEGQSIRWSVETTPPSPGGNHIHHQHEQVLVDGEIILERQGKNMMLRRETLPTLNSPQSAVALFADDPVLGRLHQIGRDLLFSTAHEGSTRRKIFPRPLSWEGTLDALRQEQEIDEIQKIAILQEHFPSVFSDIVRLFQETFPRVEAVKLREDDRLERYTSFFFEMRERGIPHPIPQHQISSGMMRTLRHLFELTLAAPGSIVLIDELENSLGYNCLGSVSESLLSTRTDLQYVITSHHPYILNQIPRERWKLVRRDGVDVRIVASRDIPELETRSRQDSFTLLLGYYDRILQEQ